MHTSCIPDAFSISTALAVCMNFPLSENSLSPLSLSRFCIEGIRWWAVRVIDQLVCGSLTRRASHALCKTSVHYLCLFVCPTTSLSSAIYQRGILHVSLVRGVCAYSAYAPRQREKKGERGWWWWCDAPPVACCGVRVLKRLVKQTINNALLSRAYLGEGCP